jgi:flagellar basal-body rod protein FlgG
MSTTFTQLLEISRSGIVGRMLDLDSVSHNLANIYTNGYKSSRVNFQELLSKNLNGVTTSSTQKMMEQGLIQTSDRALDLAIDGQGFFAIQLPDGRTAYTRDGAFQRDSAGRIVTEEGFPLIWQGQLPAETAEIEIDRAGNVRARVGQTWTQAGTIGLTRFPNPLGLNAYGNNLWLEAPASGRPQAGAANTTNYGQIISFALEKSNVNMAAEMTHMMMLQRNFEVSIKALQQSDQMMSQAILLRS